MTAAPLPLITDENRFFWQGGRDGVLQIMRCDDCAWWIHQPEPVCPVCLGERITPHATTGLGKVAAFTVNHQQWVPNLEVPYVIAIVELDEQVGLRLMTRLIGVDAVTAADGGVHVGLRVEVDFEQHDDVWLPLFRPVASAVSGHAR